MLDSYLFVYLLYYYFTINRFQNHTIYYTFLKATLNYGIKYGNTRPAPSVLMQALIKHKAI